MFESFKPRSKELEASQLATLLSENERLSDLVENLKSKMSWGAEGGDGIPSSFEPEDGYDTALKEVQEYLDGVGVRCSKTAIIHAVAVLQDPDGSLGLSEFFEDFKNS